MIRKTILTLAAASTVAMFALAPTAAVAKPKLSFFPNPHFHKHHSHHHFGRIGLGLLATSVIANDCYFVKKPTPYGYKLIKICE
jgi:hypothetical protein